MSILIKDLPEDIKKVALQKQISQGNDRNQNASVAEAFYWRKTIEGFDVWNAVEQCNYTPYYEFHGITA